MADIHPLDPRRLEPECRYLARETGQPHAVIDGVYCRDVDFVASPTCVGCGAEPDGNAHLCLRCCAAIERDRRER